MADLSTANLARIGMAMMDQSWNTLGMADDDKNDCSLQLNATAILMARLVAIAAPPQTFRDASTSVICQTLLSGGEEGETSTSSSASADQDDPRSSACSYNWPGITAGDIVVKQLYEFVGRMFQGYKQVPYHNRQHAFHVLHSTAKLVDFMITSGRKTYGLKHDPLALFALVFAALIHDVEHQGIPNRQLAIEDDRLAVLYNDQSMAENWSLYVGFSELLQNEFSTFRKALVPQEEEYRRFRRMVITMVLTTDIASPERTQVGKSKWKEAFGDPFETMERKVRETVRMARRGSAISALSGVSSRITEGEKNDADEDGSYSLTPEPSESGENSNSPDMMQNIGNIQSQLYKDYQVPDRQKFERRMSAASTSSRYRQRLGILRTVDLSGETLETYQRRGSLATATSVGSTVGGAYSIEANTSVPSTAACLFPELDDEPDDLKASVVMETLLTAADVAHNLQGWELMIKWSGRLYLELRRAHIAERGTDPQEKWFENQIGFLESYLLPLARRLEDMGVFNDEVAQMFSATVESNRDRWLREGFEEAKKAIVRGNELYPKKA